jgi:hypothetical protein
MRRSRPRRWRSAATSSARPSRRSSRKTGKASVIEWQGRFAGKSVRLRTQPRNSSPESHFFTSSNARIRGDAPIRNYLDVVVTKGELTDAELGQLAALAQKMVEKGGTDWPVRIRRKGESSGSREEASGETPSIGSRTTMRSSIAPPSWRRGSRNTRQANTASRNSFASSLTTCRSSVARTLGSVSTQDSELYKDVVAELRARGLDEEAIEEGLAKRGRTIETGDTSFAADARAFAMGSSAARPRRVGPKPPPPPQQPAPAALAPRRPRISRPARRKRRVCSAPRGGRRARDVSPEAAQSARIIRAQAGRNALDSERAVESLKTVKKLFNKMGRQASLDAYDRAERGAHTNAPEDQALAAMQKMLADKRDEIINLGTGKLSQWIANYLPHIYTDPTKAKGVIGQIIGKRPLEGTKSFLKHRAIPTLKDAMAQGLEPVSWNPVDLTLLKLREMNRYLMAQRILREHKDAGLVHFVPRWRRRPTTISASTTTSRWCTGRRTCR